MRQYVKEQKYRIDNYSSPDEGLIMTSITSKQFDDKKLGIEFQSINETGIRLQIEGHEPISAGLVRLGFYEQGAAEVLAALQAFVDVVLRKV
jgi:hypothetical protein